MSHVDPTEESAHRSAVMSESLLKFVSGQYDVAIIQTLTLSHMGIRVMDGLENCAMLTALDLSHNSIPSITDKLADFVGATLRVLDLSHNQITRCDALHGQFRSLEILHLHHNRIDGDVPSLPLPKLRRLTIAGNPFTTSSPNYRERLMASTKSLRAVDGEHFSDVGQTLRRTSVAVGDDDVVLPPTRPWISPDVFEKVLTESSTLQLTEEKNFKVVMAEMKRLLAQK